MAFLNERCDEGAIANYAIPSELETLSALWYYTDGSHQAEMADISVVGQSIAKRKAAAVSVFHKG